MGQVCDPTQESIRHIGLSKVKYLIQLSYLKMSTCFYFSSFLYEFNMIIWVLSLVNYYINTVFDDSVLFIERKVGF